MPCSSHFRPCHVSAFDMFLCELSSYLVSFHSLKPRRDSLEQSARKSALEMVLFLATQIYFLDIFNSYATASK